MPDFVSDAYYSVQALSQSLKVSEDKVLAWIRSGELAAINVATSVGRRPRWRITAEAWDGFAARRTQTVAPRHRQIRKSKTVTEFF
jgi:hypothetical protein